MVVPITEIGLAAAVLAAEGTRRPADHADEASAEGGDTDLLTRLRQRFAGDTAAEQALAAALADPDSEVALRALGERVSTYLARDPAFLSAVRDQVDAAGRADAVPSAWVRAAYIKNVQIVPGPVTVHGDLNFNNN